MNAEPAVLIERADTGIATVILNRPKIHNAFDDAMIAELTAALREVEGDAAVRVVVLAALGPSFSAGADLNWMKRMARYSEAQNRKDAMALAGLMRTLDRLSKPTIARVHGNAFAGGLGLIACCDMAIAARTAEFSVSEVKLGLIPAVISPYLVAAIGPHMARRYFLTAERFDAAEAYRIGLVHDIAEAEEIDGKIGMLASHLLKNGPRAMAKAKDLIELVGKRPADDRLIAETARRIAAIRVSAEGQEGLASFLEKRPVDWSKVAAPDKPKARRKAPATRKGAKR